ncbi:MAG: hypothetical protein IPL88_16950 [Rhizobiales bacterium]|nr:hypothetical protein [Hyphomicrobiales bacterium]
MHLLFHLLGDKALKGLSAPYVFLALAGLSSVMGKSGAFLFCTSAMAFALGWRGAPRSQAIIMALGALTFGAVVSIVALGSAAPLFAAPVAAVGAAILATIGHGVGHTFALARAGAAARQAGASAATTTPRTPRSGAWSQPKPQRETKPQPKPKPRPPRGAGAIERALAQRTPTVSPRRPSIFS